MPLIVLDAGHGGANPGATYNGRKESEDVLTLTKGNDQFQFAVNDYGLTLQSVALSRSFGEQSFTATLEHADAALLTPQEWIHTADLLQSLLSAENCRTSA